MGVCPLKAPATSAIGFSRRAHSVTCAERAPAVHTYGYAWDEPQGTGACADGADRADAAVLTYM